jgi:hypothetical protein
MLRPLTGWLTRQPAHLLRSLRSQKASRLKLETLEDRDVPSATVQLHPDYQLFSNGAKPLATSGPTGFTPAQLKQAYGINLISFSGGTVAGDGTGETIAIVDAYDDPNIASDLHQFDVQFGLPDPTFTKVNQSGGSTMPQADSGWAGEIAIDVEWAHAIAPKAKILLVEANSASWSDLSTAVRFAASQPGVAAVSMSFGGGEFSSETSMDSTFTTPSGHSGITFVASSGDSGAPVEFPAISPNVLSVGGTSLTLNSSGNYSTESAWSGSGGGISSFESQPSYQKGIVTQGTTMRTNPDVSYDANPNTGIAVYDSYQTSAPWQQYGGTSIAAPQWAAIIAIADQGRALAGLGALDGRSQTLPMLYGLPASDFHDVTSGSSTGSPSEPATAGYDLATGRGTPIANLVVAGLVGSTNNNSTHFTVSPSTTSTTAGTSFTITVTAVNSNGTTNTGYTGTVHFSSSDLQAVLHANFTFTSANKGVATFTVTLKTAGSDSLTVTDTANSTTTGSATVGITPAAANRLVFVQQPTGGSPGAALNPAVKVELVDAFGNVLTNDGTDKVTVAFGSNPGGSTLGGTATVTVSGGVATFSNLSVSKAGNGYTLVASSGSLPALTSASFNISGAPGSGNVIEGFETSDLWNVVGPGPTAFRSTAAAHDGTYGLDMYNGPDWIYRSDSAAQVKAGDTISTWVKFSNSADGRAYFGFGAGAGGTLSLVAAPNTGQLILQSNIGYGYLDMAAVGQSYQANHWYRLEVDWGTSGTIVGKLFDSNGTTLLSSVTAKTTAIMSGGIAFRALGSDKFFDTVTVNRGVNTFGRNAVAASTPSTTTTGSPLASLAAAAATGTPGLTMHESQEAELAQLYQQGSRSARAASLLGLQSWEGFASEWE